MSQLTYCFDDYDLEGLGVAAAQFGTDRFGYVVTPNTDHLIRLHEDAVLRSVYADASFVALDSRFVALLLRLFRNIRLPVCTGSDLTAHLLGEVLGRDDPVVLIGSTPEQVRLLQRRYGLRRLVHHNPPMGFIRNQGEVETCLRFVEAHSPFRLCLLAVGSPQQELLAQRLQARGIAKGLALCIGASIDFLTGAERRAPRWMQACGLEWLYRLVQNPRRLAYRYLVRGPRVFSLLRKARFVLRPPAPAPVLSLKT